MSGGPLALSLLSGVFEGTYQDQGWKMDLEWSDNLRQLYVVSRKLIPNLDGTLPLPSPWGSQDGAFSIVTRLSVGRAEQLFVLS